MTSRSKFPTAGEDIALNAIFAALGESRFNRTADEYEAIKSKIFSAPKRLLGEVNKLLAALHAESNGKPPQICRFRAGDKRIVFEPYPKSITYQTFLSALNAIGLRSPRRRRSKA